MKKLWKKCTAFLTSVRKSCYDMEWYREVRRRKPARAFAYLAWFCALMSVISTAVLVPVVSGHVADARQVIAETFSGDAVFTIEDGEFSTSAEPSTEFEVRSFVVVIDPRYEGSEPPEAFYGRSGVYVGKHVAIYQDDIEWRSFSFADVDDVTFSHHDLLTWIAANRIVLIISASLIFAIVHFFILAIGSLVFTAFGAAALMLIGRLSGAALSYGTWFALGLHAVTLPTIIDFVMSVSGLDIPLAFPVVFFMIMFSVLQDERASPVISSEKSV